MQFCRKKKDNHQKNSLLALHTVFEFQSCLSNGQTNSHRMVLILRNHSYCMFNMETCLLCTIFQVLPRKLKENIFRKISLFLFFLIVNITFLYLLFIKFWCFIYHTFHIFNVNFAFKVDLEIKNLLLRAMHFRKCICAFKVNSRTMREIY